MTEDEAAFKKSLREMYEKHHGKKLWISTDICDAWRAHHSNCIGCKHEDHCEGFTLWMLSIVSGHDPTEFINDPSKYDPNI